MTALGFIEAPFLSIAAVVADAAVKSAQVKILGFEATGGENIAAVYQAQMARRRRFARSR